MTWWAWTLLWLVLVLAAGGFLFVAGRRLLRQGLALARELSDAAELLARVSERLEEQSPVAADPPADASMRGTPDRRRRPTGRQDVR